MRIPALLTIALVFAPELASPARARLSGTLVVANKSGDSLSFIDLALEREVARIPVGGAPHELAISPDGRTVLVGEYGPDEAHGGTVAIVDVLKHRVTARIDVGEKTRPHSVVFMPDGNRAVVTLQERDELAIVDIGTKRVLRTLPTGGRESHMVRLSPDARRAYVTARRGEGTLSVVFLEEDREPVVIPTGAGAEGIAVTPDGGEVWVLDRAADTISIVDASSLSVEKQLPSRPSANRVAISHDGRAFVTNGGSGANVVQYLNVYDVATKSRLHEVTLRGGEPGSGAFGILAHEQHVFISDTNGGRILVYDAERLDSPRILLTGREAERPDGMVWSPKRVEGVVSIR
jgi:DNA-binding beta-propeller fold protein YncE